jgi:hypothetical protein
VAIFYAASGAIIEGELREYQTGKLPLCVYFHVENQVEVS